MVTPDTIAMHFSEISGCECIDKGWVEVDVVDVHTKLDLKTDEYVFQTRCKDCMKVVENRRRAFR